MLSEATKFCSCDCVFRDAIDCVWVCGERGRGVVRPCPPIRDDIVIPGDLLTYNLFIKLKLMSKNCSTGKASNVETCLNLRDVDEATLKPEMPAKITPECFGVTNDSFGVTTDSSVSNENGAATCPDEGKSEAEGENHLISLSLHF